MPDGYSNTAAFLAIILTLPTALSAQDQLSGKAATAEKNPSTTHFARHAAAPQASPASQSIKFGKVYEYVNDPAHQQSNTDQAWQFERAYHDFGAVTTQQKKEKTGHYFTFFWKPRHKLGEGRVVWDYLQEFGGNTVHTREQTFTRASGWQRTRFAVAGQDYAPPGQTADNAIAPNGGRVIAWRLRIYEHGHLAGETTSFIW